MIHFVTFLIGSGIFGLADYYYSRPDNKYMLPIIKLQKTKEIDWGKYQQTALVSLKNQLFYGIPLTILTTPIWTFEQNLFFINQINIQSLIIKVIGANIIKEGLFYYFHRLLHQPWFYKNIHRIHHEWKAPVACRALYSHPFEYIIGDAFLPILSSWLINLSSVEMSIFFFLNTIGTIRNHCGYSSSIFGAIEHDKHHQYFRCNYGSAFFDRLHGTRALDYLKKIEDKKEDKKEDKPEDKPEDKILNKSNN